jgi:hypothetical protein
LEVFQQLKLGKKHKYITFRIGDDKKEIVVEKSSTSADYDDFIADLPENECRWAVFDFEFEKEEGGKRNKIVFYSWYVPTPAHPPTHHLQSPNASTHRYRLSSSFLSPSSSLLWCWPDDLFYSFSLRPFFTQLPTSTQFTVFYLFYSTLDVGFVDWGFDRVGRRIPRRLRTRCWPHLREMPFDARLSVSQ